MKKAMVPLLTVMAVVLQAGPIFASAPPVVVTHEVKSAITEGDLITFNYTVHVTNPTTDAISDVDLSVVQLPPFLQEEKKVQVVSLAPHEQAEVHLELKVPVIVKAEEVQGYPLLFGGKCHDSRGQELAFPIVSRDGVF